MHAINSLRLARLGTEAQCLQFPAEYSPRNQVLRGHFNLSE